MQQAFKHVLLFDEAIGLLKEKTKNYGYHKFDFYLILCLEIVRYEISSTNTISNISGQAINQFASFQAFEFYYREYPQIYSKLTELFSYISEHKSELNDSNFPLLGVKDKQWIKYFEKAIKKLIISNPPNN